MAKNTINFEASIQKIEAIVAKMEEGQLPLEESLKNFEKGIQLIQNCQKLLATAEQKVQMLMEANDNTDVWVDFAKEKELSAEIESA